MMRLYSGLLIFACISHFLCDAYYNANKPRKICQECKCNNDELFVDCRQLSLYKLYEANDWNTVHMAIEKIEFDNNGIEVVTRFPNVPYFLANVRHLSFRSNKIRHIESLAFFNLTALEWLDLSDNKLTTPSLRMECFGGPFDPDGYYSLRNLKWLNLIDNNLNALNRDVFDHLDKLETLLLGKNQFQSIDPNSANAISFLKKFKVLDLSYMELRTLPEHMIHPLHSLHTLNLTGNLFMSLPAEALYFAPNLVHLNLNDNPFVHIGGEHSFPSLTKLETLSLSHSHTLQTIDEGAFHNLTALQFFTCEDNRYLSKIHPNAFANSEYSSHIRSIILSRNNLSSISEDMFKFWHEIDEIDIRYNPWQCTCENQWMIDKLIPIIKEKSKRNPSIYEDLECSSPDEMKSKKLVDLFMRGVQMEYADSHGHQPETEQQTAPTFGWIEFFIGLMVGIAMTLTTIHIYRRGCFGAMCCRQSRNDDRREFSKRADLDEYFTDK